jgi:hypothetical protein
VSFSVFVVVVIIIIIIIIIMPFPGVKLPGRSVNHPHPILRRTVPFFHRFSIILSVYIHFYMPCLEVVINNCVCCVAGLYFYPPFPPPPRRLNVIKCIGF